MYHERTQAQITAARIRRIIIACVIVLIIVAGAFGIQAFEENSRAQGALSIREAVLSTAKQCYAIEGSYPSSLRHLEEVYGLTINDDDYIVYYEWFADNMPPSVAVVVR